MLLRNPPRHRTPRRDNRSSPAPIGSSLRPCASSARNSGRIPISRLSRRSVTTTQSAPANCRMTHGSTQAGDWNGVAAGARSHSWVHSGTSSPSAVSPKSWTVSTTSCRRADKLAVALEIGSDHPVEPEASRAAAPADFWIEFPQPLRSPVPSLPRQRSGSRFGHPRRFPRARRTARHRLPPTCRRPESRSW